MRDKLIYSLLLSTRAEKEALTSYDWYEEQQKGLGERFMSTLLITLSQIETNPELFSFKCKSYREANLPTFPYVVIYRLNKRKHSIRVVSVFHTSRSPKIKYK